MKYSTLLVGVVALIASIQTYATNPQPSRVRCETTEHMHQLVLNNPKLMDQIQSDEQRLEQFIAANALNRQANSVSVIPVVVHIVYRTNGQNISDAQIQSQIDVLNEDFARLNTDASNTPSAFQSVASATLFQFCLARTDPNGNITTGIERRQTTVNSFNTNDSVKSYTGGGMDAWDVNRYFNIWVCNLGNLLLGYAEFPVSTHSNTYGVVINYDSFGRVGTVSPPYNEGRTSTHEIGHCFNLHHIWGDDGGACTGSDYVSDTPNQASETYGCRTFPAYDACTGSTGNGFMYMNYMDYSDDNCLNMFTAGQATRMSSSMNLFYPTLLTSTACETSDGISSTVNNFNFNLYPNPASGSVNVDMFLTPNIGEQITLKVTDAIGQTVYQQVIHHPNGHTVTLDLQSVPTGVYFVTVSNQDYFRTRRLELIH